MALDGRCEALGRRRRVFEESGQSKAAHHVADPYGAQVDDYVAEHGDIRTSDRSTQLLNHLHCSRYALEIVFVPVERGVELEGSAHIDEATALIVDLSAGASESQGPVGSIEVDKARDLRC